MGGWVTTVCTGSGRPGAKGSERALLSSFLSWREVPSSPCWDDQGSARTARQSLRTVDPDGPRDGRAPLRPPPPVQPCAWDGPRLAALEYRPWTFHDLRINGPCTAFPVSCIFQKETFKNVENVLAVAPKKERKESQQSQTRLDYTHRIRRKLQTAITDSVSPFCCGIKDQSLSTRL